MANTSLFAPQIKAIQPAFQYANATTSVNIYFTPSSYTIMNTTVKVGYQLIDPNKKSASGNHVIIKNLPGAEAEYYQDPETQEYYFILQVPSGLTFEQYYQVQIYLIDGAVQSPWSQISLIKPVFGYSSTIIININENQSFISPPSISGSVTPLGTSKDFLQSFKYSILNSLGQSIHQSPQLTSVNEFNFEFTVDSVVLNNAGSYRVILDFLSINGYTSTASFSFTMVDPVSAASEWDNRTASNRLQIDFLTDLETGAVDFHFKWHNYQQTSNGMILIQRSDRMGNFLNWKNLVRFNTVAKTGGPITLDWIWKDFSIEGQQTYRYRALYISGTDINAIPQLITKRIYECSTTNLDNLYLSDEDTLLIIRYNPVVSGLKWTVQETLATTLGGSYPIVRINGEVKYRTFNISGALYFNPSLNSNNVDSQLNPINKWFSNDYCDLYLSQQKINMYNQTNWVAPVLKNKLRDMAINFLTNQKPKLFRSLETGSAIVYLSNISFTPNKQLSNQIYDFSATVTEIAEYNEENLKKYNFNYKDHNNIVFSLENVSIIQNKIIYIDTNTLNVVNAQPTQPVLVYNEGL